MSSCNRSRRLYLSNTLAQPVTLHVAPGFQPKEGTITSEFRDALDKKRIEPGHVTIDFGTAKWNDSDEESLREVLQNTNISEDGNLTGFKLPEGFKIGHGLLIPELIVKISKPK